MSFLLLGGPETAAPGPIEPAGRIRVDGEVFRDEAGAVWSWRGATMFLLFRRWLLGESIDPQIAWLHQQGVTVPRVLGMVSWAGQAFGPTINTNYWTELPRFLAYLADHGLAVEFVAFADAQIGMPDPADQRAHLQRVRDVTDRFPHVFVEICNEPWKNGVVPSAIWSAGDPRARPWAYGDYRFSTRQEAGGWVADLPLLDYVTLHTPRSAASWSRKAKDLLEMRDGAGDGRTAASARWRGADRPVVDDEPMGAAEADQVAGRQRSANPDEFFWHHGVAHLFSAGSTFHCDAGLQATVPPPDGDQQRCADAVSLIWRLIEPEWQLGQYTRSGLASLPLAWSEADFPPDTSRIYGRILGSRACCVAVKPAGGWRPVAIDDWRIVATAGPQDSLVLLER